MVSVQFGLDWLSFFFKSCAFIPIDRIRGASSLRVLFKQICGTGNLNFTSFDIQHHPKQSPSQLVSWCFQPRQQQRIISGLKTNFNLSAIVIHSTSLFYSNHSFLSNTYFGTYLRSVALDTGTYISGLLRWAGWPTLFCGPTQQPVLATANTAKTPESFGENAGEWTGKVEISKEESSGSKRSMYGHILTYSRL